MRTEEYKIAILGSKRNIITNMSQKMSSAADMIGAFRAKSLLIQMNVVWKKEDLIVFEESVDKIRLCIAQSDLVLAFCSNNFHSSRTTTRYIISNQALILCRLIHNQLR